MEKRHEEATYEEMKKSIPVVDEEHEKDFRRFVEIMFRRAVRSYKEGEPNLINIGQEHDEFFEEIFDSIGRKYGITSEQVRNYITAEVSRMIQGAHQKLDKDSDYDILFDEDFVTLENFIIFMYTLVCRGIREKYYQTES